jgi:3-oxoacyl-[acyl-carrier protein] reductase
MDDITGKIALVTGGSRGIGRAITLELARAGADVALCYRQNEAEGDAAARDIAALGRRALALRADVSKSNDVSALVERVTAELGPIDILVNNAGISRPASVDALTEALFDETLEVNLKSVFLVTQAVVPGMRQRRWGRIVNLTSTAAQIGGVVGPHYAASKAGIIGLTHGYASQLAKEGITCNALAPALIETDMVKANSKATASMIPLGRFGTVDETAGAALMLVRNGYVTGQTLNVNGGVYMTS